MKLPNKTLNKLIMCVVFIVLLQVTISLCFHTDVAAVTITGAKDYIDNDDLNQTNVSHNVSFVVPIGGHSIIASDYIRIELTNFTSVTAPTSISGYTSGTPSFGVTGGNIAYVTGITAPNGVGIGISGITATNPADVDDFDVTIEIADDISGTIVYDSATINAQALKSSVTTSVTFGGPTSSIQVLGYSSPSAFITILLNGSVGGTTIANGSGFFSKTITGLTPGTTYAVGIFGQDTFLRQTQTVSFIVNTLAGITHIFSDIVIPTTIAIDDTDINKGEILTISGLSHPNSQITIFVGAGSPYSFVISSNAQGVWSYGFNSQTYPLATGNHATFAREVVTGGYTSIFTQSLNFNANNCIAADINCDGKVNLTDFSIMLFYWNQKNPVNARADINEDTFVNLTDFSIMLFYWTG